MIRPAHHATWPMLLAVLTWPAATQAAAESSRTMMPEPLVGESITDIDNIEGGELELDVTGGLLGRTSGGAMLWSTSIEAEWRANEKLGLAAEVGVAGTSGLGLMDPDQTVVSLRVAGSWAILNDFKHDLHLQAQVSARVFAALWPDDDFALGESALPYAFRLHGAWRRGGLNLRAGIGAAVRRAGVYTLLLSNAALLYEWGSRVGQMRRAFVGLEVDADGARSAPLVLIPEAAVSVAPFGLPARIGVAFPLAPDLTGHGLIAGALLRITMEIDKD